MTVALFIQKLVERERLLHTISIIKDDQRTLSSEFESDPLKVDCGSSVHDDTAHLK